MLIKSDFILYIIIKFLTISIICCNYFVFSHVHEDEKHCKHEHPKADDVVRGVHIEEPHIVHRRSITQQLRISIFYDHSVYRLEQDKLDLINNTILPDAVNFWERALTVRKTVGPIRLNRKCPSRQVFIRHGRTHCIDTCKVDTMCGEVHVPEQHLNPCYVCNSTGHDCRALSVTEMSERGMLQQDFITTTEENTDNYTTESADGSTRTKDLFTSSGVDDADFVLYVSAVETGRCKRGLAVAYAAHCQQESALDRPVAGHANFCPSELSTDPQELQSMLATVKHEMLHALGFSISLFAFYRDDNGLPLTERRSDTGTPVLNEELQVHQWSERVVKKVSRPRWLVRGGYVARDVNMIVTPRVVKEVRDHFNCSQLEGAELEDQGGDGTSLTHWEKRLFENEAMTGTHTQSSVFTRVTLALMEDTGWYRADYNMAEPLDWGKGLGCDFAMKSCKEWIAYKQIKRRKASPYCTRVKEDPLRTECNSRRSAVTLCNLMRYDTVLPRIYQHFDRLSGVQGGQEVYYGGSVSLADYCPYLQQFSWRQGSVLVRGSQCSYKENTPKYDMNFALEHYGKNSKCFEHSDHTWEQRSCRQIREWQHWGSGCYKYKCEHGRLHILVGNYTYSCYHAGQILRVRIERDGWLHRGGVVCPPCKEICADDFLARGEYCKGGEEAPPPTDYPMDALTCSAASRIQVAAGLLVTLYILNT